ncbi:MAG: undecaprenyl/decaprenyl-phosphate alpha-N-acetylglucosaminyl 1-phosphate transferase [Acidobacteria bacterium]|nr:undecaprenyl/decaprenyl-phosphate alpha-N-acetylglucosaminyl 1-phosphate transferase [Acidobacteriota bacterium]
MPRLGGVAVILAVALTCELVAFATAASGAAPAPVSNPHVRSLLIGGMLVFAVGLVDDLRGVPPLMKLLVQVLAAALVVQNGRVAEALVFVKGMPALTVGPITSAVVVLWIVGVTNAFNLIDGLDGLAGACALVAISTLAVAGRYLGEPTTFVLTAALAGALVPFLRRNWHPAKVFLGDSGSMTIGFLLAVRSLTSATDARGQLHVLVPIAALAYPLLDTLVAIARRWLRGHSFSRADDRHIHHQLVTIGLSVPRAVGLLVALGMGLGGAALAISFAPPQLTVALIVSTGLLSAALGLYGIWRLGYNEFVALGKAVYSGLARTRWVVRERIRVSDIARAVKEAQTEFEVHGCVNRLVDREHVWRAELVEPSANPQEIFTAHEAPADVWGAWFRFDCPIRGRRTGRVLHLRVWATSTAFAHHTIQRLQAILCPELELWFDRHEREVPVPVALEDRVVQREQLPNADGARLYAPEVGA